MGPAELLTGWSQAEALGHALNEILGQTACPKQTTLALVPSMVSGAHEDKPCADTAILVRRDGVELNVKNCSGYIRDRDGNVTGTVAVLHDLGAVRAQILEISQAAQHDFLTGLPNRSLVNDRITQAISFPRAIHQTVGGNVCGPRSVQASRGRRGRGDRGTTPFSATRRLQRGPRLLFLPPGNCRKVRPVSATRA
jgi:hypothetical protein